MTNRIYLFTRFERFWHWTQAALIIFMAVTGFEIRTLYHLFGFEQAVFLHTFAAWGLIGLWVFAVFWHATTGEWKQYIPTMDQIVLIMRYYSVDIFSDAPHPYQKTRMKKHNPLQRLVYLSLWVFIYPAIWVSGILYLFYQDWQAWGIAAYLNLEVIGIIHASSGFLIITFLIGHVYLVTTGRTTFIHIKAMITGWEDVDHTGRESD